MFRKERIQSLFFYFQGKHPRKDETNETENKPVDRRIGTDCSCVGGDGIYPWRSTDLAACSGLCGMGNLGWNLFLGALSQSADVSP